MPCRWCMFCSFNRRLPKVLSDSSYDYFADEEVTSYAARGTLIGSVEQASITGENACHPYSQQRPN
eukprot:scaffold72561_cov39-Attheya_sp.AAC.1